MSVSLDTDWSKLGFDGSPLPGDPRVLQGVIDDFGYLGDMASSVSQGLNAFVAQASGGFEGATADALQEVISGQLKAFIFNIARAFSLAGEAVAAYRTALTQGQQAVAGAMSQTEGLVAGDPKLAELKRQVQDQMDQVGAAARTMEAALRDASQMVSQPIKVPSLGERIHKKLELALSIAGGALSLLSMVVDGPVGFALAAAVWTTGAAALGLTVEDYEHHRTKWWEVLLAGTGLLVPWERGMFSMAELGAGSRALLGGMGLVGLKAVRMLSSPATFREFLVLSGQLTWQALSRVPRLAMAGLTADMRAIPAVFAAAPGAIKDGLRWAGDAIGRDIDRVVKWYPSLAGAVGEYTAYGLVNAGRLLGAAFTPMRFREMAEFGFHDAWLAMRERMSFSRAVEAFRTGWTQAGAARAGVEMRALLDAIQGFRPGARAVGKAGPAVGFSWPGRWADASGKLREPPPLLLPAGLGTAGGPSESSASTLSKLWLPGQAGRQAMRVLDRLGAAGLEAGRRPELPEALLRPSSFMWPSSFMRTPAGALVRPAALGPVALGPEAAPRLRQLTWPGTDRSLTGTSSASGASGALAHPLAHPGELALRQDGAERLPAPRSEVSQTLDLLSAGPTGPSTVRSPAPSLTREMPFAQEAHLAQEAQPPGHASPAGNSQQALASARPRTVAHHPYLRLLSFVESEGYDLGKAADRLGITPGALVSTLTGRLPAVDLSDAFDAAAQHTAQHTDQAAAGIGTGTGTSVLPERFGALLALYKNSGHDQAHLASYFTHPEAAVRNWLYQWPQSGKPFFETLRGHFGLSMVDRVPLRGDGLDELLHGATVWAIHRPQAGQDFEILGDTRLSIDPVGVAGQPPHGFTVTDLSHGVLHFRIDPEVDLEGSASAATLVHTDQALTGMERGAEADEAQRVAVIRLPMEGPNRAPRLLDAEGDPVTVWPAGAARDGRVALRPHDALLTSPVQLVIDPADGRVLKQTLSAHSTGFGPYWQIDYAAEAVSAVRLDDAGRTADVHLGPDGVLRLVDESGEAVLQRPLTDILHGRWQPATGLRTVELPGSGGVLLRFPTGEAVDFRDAELVGADSGSLPGAHLLDHEDHSLDHEDHSLDHEDHSGFTVRLPVPGIHEAAAWHLDRYGALLRREVPVTGPGLPARLWISIAYADPRNPSYEIRSSRFSRDGFGTSPRHFTAGPLPAGLVARHPDGIALTYTPTGWTFYLDGMGRIVGDEGTLAPTVTVVNRVITEPPGPVTETVRLDETVHRVTEVVPLSDDRLDAAGTASDDVSSREESPQLKTRSLTEVIAALQQPRPLPAEPGAADEEMASEEMASEEMADEETADEAPHGGTRPGWAGRLSAGELAQASIQLRASLRSGGGTSAVASRLGIPRERATRLISGHDTIGPKVLEQLAERLGRDRLTAAPIGENGAVDAGAGETLYVNKHGHFTRRTLRLPGSGGALAHFSTRGVVRFSDVRLIDADGDPFPGASRPGAEVAPERGNKRPGFTVRLPVPGAGKQSATWHFDYYGVLRSHEIPVTGHRATQGMRVRVTHTYGPDADTETHSYQIVRARTGKPVQGIAAVSLPPALAGRLPGGFALIRAADHHVTVFDESGHIAPGGLFTSEELAAVHAPAPHRSLPSTSSPIPQPLDRQQAAQEDIRTRLLMLSKDRTVHEVIRLTGGGRRQMSLPTGDREPRRVAEWLVGKEAMPDSRAERLKELVVPVAQFGEGIEALRGVTVWELRLRTAPAAREDEAAAPLERQFKVVGASDVTVEPLDEELAEEWPAGFTLVSASADSRFHVRFPAQVDETGQAQVHYADWWFDGLGTLRIPMADRNAVPWWLVDATPDAIAEWRPERLPDGRVELRNDLEGQKKVVDPYAETPVDERVMLLRGVDSLRNVNVVRGPGAPGRGPALRLLRPFPPEPLDQIEFLIQHLGSIRYAAQELKVKPQWVWESRYRRYVPESHVELVKETAHRLWRSAPSVSQWEVVFRQGGGVSLSQGAQGMLHFTADGVFGFRTVGIRGTDRVLRFDHPEDVGENVLAQVAGQDGIAVPARGFVDRAEDGLTLRMPVSAPGAQERWGQWHFDSSGAPQGFEMPLTGAHVPPGLAVRGEVDPGGAERLTVVRKDSGEPAEGFTVRPVVPELAGEDELRDGFTVTEAADGRSWHFSSLGRARYLDQPDARRLRLDSGPDAPFGPEPFVELPRGVQQAQQQAQGYARLRALARQESTWERVGERLGGIDRRRLQNYGRGWNPIPTKWLEPLAEAVGDLHPHPHPEPGPDGGFVVDAGAGERLHYTEDWRLRFRLLRLPGSDRWLRFVPAKTMHRDARLADAQGELVDDPRITLTVKRGGGRLGGADRLTVRWQMPGTHETAQWHIDPIGVLRWREVPVTGPGMPVQLRVRIKYAYPGTDGDARVASYEVRLVRTGKPATLFQAAALQGVGAADHPDGIALTFTRDGRTLHLDGMGQVIGEQATPAHPAAVQEPRPMETDTPSPEAAEAPGVPEASETPEALESLESLGAAESPEAPESLALAGSMVSPQGATSSSSHTNTNDFRTITDDTDDTDDWSSEPTRSEVVLTGEALPESLCRLRLVTTWHRLAEGAEGPAFPLPELEAPQDMADEDFDDFTVDPVEGALAERLPGGATVTDHTTEIRYHFTALGVLSHRDVPFHHELLSPQAGQVYLRVDVNDPGRPPEAVDDYGEPSPAAARIGLLGEGRAEVLPAAPPWGDAADRLVVDLATGRLIAHDIDARHGIGGMMLLNIPGMNSAWRIAYSRRTAEYLNILRRDGVIREEHVIESAAVSVTPEGRLRIVGADGRVYLDRQESAAAADVMRLHLADSADEPHALGADPAALVTDEAHRR